MHLRDARSATADGADGTPHAIAPRRRRRALVVFFLVPGVAMATWVTRTPAIRDDLGASLTEMGLVLLGLSAGSLAGVIGSGRVVARVGTRRTTLVGAWLTVAALAVIALASAVGTAPLAAIGLGLFGLGMGMCEIAINVDGADVERLLQRSVMHVLHGSYSLGTFIGAVVGLACNAMGVPVPIHLLAVAVAMVPAVLVFARDLPDGIGLRTGADASWARRTPWRPDARLVLIAVIAFAMALAEGTANDWLPILVVDVHGASESLGALAFAAFAGAMTIGRLGGGALVDRIGRVRALAASASLAAAAIAVLALGHGPVTAVAAALAWGVGASLAFPLAISAAGDGGPVAAERVQFVAVLGYVALLVGPPALGFLGDHAGLRAAMLLVCAVVVAVALASPAVRAGRRGSDPAP